MLHDLVADVAQCHEVVRVVILRHAVRLDVVDVQAAAVLLYGAASLAAVVIPLADTFGKGVPSRPALVAMLDRLPKWVPLSRDILGATRARTEEKGCLALPLLVEDDPTLRADAIRAPSGGGGLGRRRGCRQYGSCSVAFCQPAAL